MKKNNVKKNNVSKVAVNQKSHDFFSNADFFSNEIADKIITVDVSAIEKVDVMSTSRIAFFRKLVKLDTNFNTLAIYDYRFYNKTNDRSKTRKSDKYNDNELNISYVRMRTAKQLHDVLKEKDVVSHLNRKYNKSQQFYTVSEYKAIVK